VSVKFPEATAGPDYLIRVIDPRLLLNDPDGKLPDARTSWVREWLLANREEVFAVTFARKEGRYTSENGVLKYENGQPVFKYQYQIPAPIARDIPEDVVIKMIEHFNKEKVYKQEVDKLFVLPTPKQFALDWVILVSPTLETAPWMTSKAGGVSNQPGTLAKETLTFPVNVLGGEDLFQHNGCLRISFPIMAQLALAYGVIDENHYHKTPTAMKFSGKWPHCAKFVVYVDPNYPKDPAGFDYWNGNDKGEKRKPGPAIFSTDEFRLVATSNEYFKIGTHLSYQCLSLCSNWKEIAKTKVADQLKILKGIVKGDAQCLITAMKVNELLNLTDAPSVDGTDREFYSQAEFLLATGATAKNHPVVQKAAWRTAHWFCDSLRRGVFVEEGHMGYALPSTKCAPGEVIISKAAWKKLGKPEEAWVIRYPINQKSEIRKYRVRYTFGRRAASDHAIFVNAQDWHAHHNGDFDGDLCFLYCLDLQVAPEEAIALQKGKGREVASFYEEAYKTCVAGGSVGSICNALTYVRAIRECFGKDTSQLEAWLAEGYHNSIQATKNADFDTRKMMQVTNSWLKQNKFGTKMPWIGKKWDTTAEGWNHRISFHKNIGVDDVTGEVTDWSGCLLGWVNLQIGKCGWFALTEPIAFKRDKFGQILMKSPILVHDIRTDMLVRNLMTEFSQMLDGQKLSTVINGFTLTVTDPKAKPNFKKVREAAQAIKELEPFEREIASIMVGHRVATTNMSDFLYCLVAPTGPGSVAEKAYGGKALNNLKGQWRRAALWEELRTSKEEQSSP